MKYIIEKKKSNRTSYSKNQLFIRVVDNFITTVVDISKATKFHKGSLKKYYNKFGRENLIVKRVNE